MGTLGLRASMMVWAIAGVLQAGGACLIVDDSFVKPGRASGTTSPQNDPAVPTSVTSDTSDSTSGGRTGADEGALDSTETAGAGNSGSTSGASTSDSATDETTRETSEGTGPTDSASDTADLSTTTFELTSSSTATGDHSDSSTSSLDATRSTDSTEDTTGPSTTSDDSGDASVETTNTTGETTMDTSTTSDELPELLVFGDSVRTDFTTTSAWDPIETICPVGQVVTGATGRTTLSETPWITALQLQCSHITLSGELVPATSVVPGDRLAEMAGNNMGNEANWSMACPPGKVVVGAVVSMVESSISIEHILFDCATLLYKEESAPSELEASELEQVGPDSAASAQRTHLASCPPGHVAVGMTVKTGFYFNAISSTCRPWATSG